jgi:hypothetical protein
MVDRSLNIVCFAFKRGELSHNIMILGHVMVQHTIPCSGATQTHNLCVVYLPNGLLSSQKRDLSVFLSHSKGKCLRLCSNHAFIQAVCTRLKASSTIWIKEQSS